MAWPLRPGDRLVQQAIALEANHDQGRQQRPPRNNQQQQQQQQQRRRRRRALLIVHRQDDHDVGAGGAGGAGVAGGAGGAGESPTSGLSGSSSSSLVGIRARPRAASLRAPEQPSTPLRRAGDRSPPRAAAAVAVPGPQLAGSYWLLGVDQDAEGEEVAIGLAFQLQWDAQISLDGDGGFSVRQLGQHFIFKPVSVKALWTVIQTLHMIVAEKLRPRVGGALTSPGTTPASCVEARQPTYPITSSQACINEWHFMADVLVRRPSPVGQVLEDEAEDEAIEGRIKTELRQIMKQVNLDTITSKSLRSRLEILLGRPLDAFKSFIDKEILLILGQMDPASEILSYLYLGSEWNASNLEELHANGITHILNVTREIDNFFPEEFAYKNVREYDEEATDLLKYLDSTYKFIKAAKEENGKVLIHCKMGISRSATVTISYIMKEQSQSLENTLSFVKSRRPIVNPNKSFLKQLEVYEGILSAFRYRHTYLNLASDSSHAPNYRPTTGLYRSKSESSLVPSSPCSTELESPMSQENLSFKGDSPARKVSLVDSIRIDFKALSSVFMESPNKVMAKSKAFSTKSLALLEDECRCYGELEEAAPITITSDSNSFVEATNPHLLPVNKASYDPECNCDVEYELGVPEEPILVAESAAGSIDSLPGGDKGEQLLVQNMSNLPLQMRARKEPSQVSRSESEPPPDFNIVSDGKEEELSVKTLASMFDFKVIGSVPLRPCSARLEDSQLFQRGQKLCAGEISKTKEATPQSDC